MKSFRRTTLFLICMALVADAATFYVAPTGSDANPGTINLPWASPAKAAAVLQAGDSAYFRQGSYVLGGYVSLGRSGTASAPIVLASYPGETATLIYDAISVADPTTKIVVFISASFITIDRLAFTQSQRSWNALAPSATFIHGISVWGTSVTVKNCIIDSMSATGIYIAGANFLAEGCAITGTRSHGFYIAGADGVYRNNRLDGGGGYSNQQGIQIQYKSSQRNKIYGNLIANGQASGVVFSGMVSNNEVFNNVFADCGAKAGGGYGYPLNFWHEDGPIGVGNRFYNNTILGEANSGLIAPTDGAPVEIFNNIFYPSTPVFAGGDTGYNIRNNVFWNVTGPVPAGNIQKDPLLQDPNGKTVESAKLKANSPCIDAGLAPGAPAFDYAGTTRPKGNGFDIGAYEYVAAPVIHPRRTVVPHRLGAITIRPAGSGSRICWNGQPGANVSVYSLAGKQVFSFNNIGLNGTVWNTRESPAGIYLVQVQSGKSVYTAKVYCAK